jgi:hypothetical protein
VSETQNEIQTEKVRFETAGKLPEEEVFRPKKGSLSAP